MKWFLIDPELRKALISGRPSVWIAVFVFAAINLAVFVLPHLFSDHSFDSTRWKYEQDERPRMVRDLLENHDLAGKSREYVDLMLGVPCGRDSDRNGKYTYWAGTDGVIDDMWLEVQFEGDSVVSVRYIPD